MDGFEIISGNDAYGTVSRVVSNLRLGMECYFDGDNLSSILRLIAENNRNMLSLRSNRARLRCLTEIKRENLSECKELMKHFELFHSSMAKGAFMITDGREYLGFLGSEKNKTLLRISDPAFVGMQKFLLDEMFDRAVPASQRIREIGKGTEEEFMETIRDPDRIKSTISRVIQSALSEIDVLFSTKNFFLIAEKEGILEEIGNVSGTGVKVRILVMHDQIVKDISNSKLKMEDLLVQINYMQQILPTKITTFIIDQAKSLTIEINDDSKDCFNEAVGLGSYSNSESTVFSNVSMFESLWIQSEVDRQNEAKNAYFQLFKGVTLKDEIYRRRWTTNSGSEQKSD